MDDVIRRSAWLLVAAVLIVLVSTVFGQGGDGDLPGHDAADHAAVAGEAGFIAGMIPHHQEAVDSAMALSAATERAEMQELARSIIQGQSAEIERLQGWLRAWYPGAEPDPDYRPMMRDRDGLGPDEADRAFLEDMLRHHDMAIDMARAYLAGSFEKRAEVVAMAEQIGAAQQTENERMRAWLAEWFGAEAEGHQGH